MRTAFIRKFCLHVTRQLHAHLETQLHDYATSNCLLQATMLQLGKALFITFFRYPSQIMFYTNFITFFHSLRELGGNRPQRCEVLLP